MLSDVIVEDIVGLCTCTYKKAMVYYSIVLCCGMYEEYCNCDNVHKDSIPVLSTVCISTPSFEFVVQRIKMWGCYCYKLWYVVV